MPAMFAAGVESWLTAGGNLPFRDLAAQTLLAVSSCAVRCRTFSSRSRLARRGGRLRLPALLLSADADHHSLNERRGCRSRRAAIATLASRSPAAILFSHRELANREKMRCTSSMPSANDHRNRAAMATTIRLMRSSSACSRFGDADRHESIVRARLRARRRHEVHLVRTRKAGRRRATCRIGAHVDVCAQRRRHGPNLHERLRVRPPPAPPARASSVNPGPGWPWRHADIGIGECVRTGCSALEKSWPMRSSPRGWPVFMAGLLASAKAELIWRPLTDHVGEMAAALVRNMNEWRRRATLSRSMKQSRACPEPERLENCGTRRVAKPRSHRVRVIELFTVGASIRRAQRPAAGERHTVFIVGVRSGKRMREGCRLTDRAT